MSDPEIIIVNVGCWQRFKDWAAGARDCLLEWCCCYQERTFSFG